MMKAADHRHRNHIAAADRLDGSRHGRVLAEGQVRSGAVVVLEVVTQDAAQMVRAQDAERQLENLNGDN